MLIDVVVAAVYMNLTTVSSCFTLRRLIIKKNYSNEVLQSLVYMYSLHIFLTPLKCEHEDFWPLLVQGICGNHNKCHFLWDYNGSASVYIFHGPYV